MTLATPDEEDGGEGCTAMPHQEIIQVKERDY